MSMIEKIRNAQKTAPVDVVGLCRDLGIEVHEAWLENEISGELVSKDNGAYQINVNASHAETRKRFTIAHELGHFIYHRDLIGTGIDDDRAYRSTDVGRYHNINIGPRQETEANKFAANLLMPKELILEMKNRGLTSSQMAQELKVSQQAMDIRLEVC